MISAMGSWESTPQAKILFTRAERELTGGLPHDSVLMKMWGFYFFGPQGSMRLSHVCGFHVTLASMAKAADTASGRDWDAIKSDGWIRSVSELIELCCFQSRCSFNHLAGLRNHGRGYVTVEISPGPRQSVVKCRYGKRDRQPLLRPFAPPTVIKFLTWCHESAPEIYCHLVETYGQEKGVLSVDIMVEGTAINADAFCKTLKNLKKIRRQKERNAESCYQTQPVDSRLRGKSRRLRKGVDSTHKFHSAHHHRFLPESNERLRVITVQVWPIEPVVDGVQAPKHVLREQVAGDDRNRLLSGRRLHRRSDQTGLDDDDDECFEFDMEGTKKSTTTNLPQLPEVSVSAELKMPAVQPAPQYQQQGPPYGQPPPACVQQLPPYGQQPPPYGQPPPPYGQPPPAQGAMGPPVEQQLPAEKQLKIRCPFCNGTVNLDISK
ncbi:hypothetical protein AAG570_003933 [Ranatra chinensis]|uniref:Uncharacterized protein n=1 Tax=Ranatra chinensis TaxID=642074 RepID=A0ABD0YEX1_9HEMI